jgi:tRNA-Thr(GGU) m(6)t(6)A37 methyltransferase TsaA
LSADAEARTPMMLEPIGFVKNSVQQVGMRCWKGVVSEIAIIPGLEDALDGLEDFSHAMVLFWMHRSPGGNDIPMKTHPQRRPDLPLVGVFATRSPVRPNPLGIATVRLIERSGNILRVEGLDAIDGTPVVDLKPCLPGDTAEQISVPDWVHKLRRS